MPSTRSKLVNQIDTFSSLEQRLYPASAMDLWYTEFIPTMTIPKAFAFLRFGFIQESPFYKPLMKAMLTFHVMHVNRRGTPYKTLTETKRQAALIALSGALEPFPQSYTDWFDLLPESDRWKSIVQERYEGWLASQKVEFSATQLWWLERIKDTIVQSAQFSVDDLELAPFSERGGADGIGRDLGSQALDIINAMNEALSV